MKLEAIGKNKHCEHSMSSLNNLSLSLSFFLFFFWKMILKMKHMNGIILS